MEDATDYLNKRHFLYIMEDNVNSIAADIMAYLHQRPLASDSLEGITHWWLVHQAIDKNKNLVEKALEELSQEGKIIKKLYSNREAIYSLDPTFKPSKE